MRRWLLPVGAYVAITIALTYPLLTRFASAFPHDAGDPVLNTWILWWSTQRAPLTAAWWNAPMFFPTANAMALSEVLVGLLPITAVVQWLTSSPIAAYNVAFLLSFPLCGLAAYMLAEELTGRRDAAFAAGLAFAFAPYRMGQLAHLQMLSYYWAPVALVGLHRYVGTGRWKWLAVFGGAWLMQALSNGYALFHLSIFLVLWIAWFARSLRTAGAIVIAWTVAALPVVPFLWKYREVHGALHLVRDINEIKGFGVDLADLLTAPAELLVWGSRLWPARPETAAFPGITLLLVGATWLVWSWSCFMRSRRWWPSASSPWDPGRSGRCWSEISTSRFRSPWGCDCSRGSVAPGCAAPGANDRLSRSTSWRSPRCTCSLLGRNRASLDARCCTSRPMRGSCARRDSARSGFLRDL